MESLSDSFRALGEPTRLRLLRVLDRAPMNISELVSVVGLSQSSVSHHLAKLRSLEFIGEEKRGNFTFCSIRHANPVLEAMLVAIRRSDDSQGDLARAEEVLKSREDRLTLNDRLLEPGQNFRSLAQVFGSLLPPMSVADFGCGAGTVTVEVARFAKHVTAIDVSAEAVKSTRTLVEKEGLSNVSFLQADLEKLPLPKSSVDLVLMSQSLHHVDRPEAVIREAFRVLRSKGKIAILDLLPHKEEWVFDRLGHLANGFDPEHIKKSLHDCKFRNISQRILSPQSEAGFRVFLTIAEVPARK